MTEAVVVASRYQLVEHLGSGAMADVWKARDLRFDDLFVAVKLLKGDQNYAEFESARGRIAKLLAEAATPDGTLDPDLAVRRLGEALQGQVDPGVLRARIDGLRHRGRVLVDEALRLFDDLAGNPEYSASAKMRARLRRLFKDEANSVANLKHENIVNISDTGEQDGRPFLVMEFIEGRTLDRVIRTERTGLVRKLAWMEQLCAGLAFAHSRRLVHRDIKPANLMIQAASATLKILDFGVVRRLHDSSESTAGMPIGTFSYMSPEQLLGSVDLDHRSDVFSVGAVFYELLAGVKAFPPGDGLADLMGRIQRVHYRPLADVIPDIDRDVVTILHRALKKSPRSRYPDLSQMRADLARLRARLEREQTQVFADTVVNPFTRGLRAASEAVQAGELEEAEAELEHILALDPSNTEALRLTAQIQALRRDQQAAVIATEVRRHIEADDFRRARSVLKAHEALAGHPGVASLHGEVDDAERRARDAERMRRVASLLTSAREHLAGGRFDRAIECAAQVVALDDNNADARAIEAEAVRSGEEQRRLTEQAQRRQVMVDTGRAAIRDLLAARQFEAADRELANLLILAPGEPALGVLRDEITAARLGEATRVLSLAERFELEGRLEDAVTLLLGEETVHPNVAAQLRRLRTDWQARKDREQRTEELLREATERFVAGELDQALAECSAILDLDGGHAGAKELKLRAQHALAVREAEISKQRDIASWLAAAADAIDRRDLGEASRLADRVKEREPSLPALLILLSRLEGAQRQQQEHARRLAAIDGLLERAAALLVKDAVEEAEAAIGEARDLGAEGPRLAEISERVAASRTRRTERIDRETREVVQEATRLAKRGRLQDALELLSQHQLRFPAQRVRLEGEAARLRSLAESRARAHTAWRVSRRAALAAAVLAAVGVTVAFVVMWPPDPAPSRLQPSPVTVNLRPWARVRIEPLDAGGADFPEESQVTPFTVELVPGRYRLHAENADLDFPPEQIDIDVEAGTPLVVDQALSGFDSEALVNKLLGPP